MAMPEIICFFFFILQIGNDVIHHITNQQPHSMYVIFKLNNGDIFHQKYEDFSIGDESTNYQLHLAGPTTGNLGTQSKLLNIQSPYFATISNQKCNFFAITRYLKRA